MKSLRVLLPLFLVLSLLGFALTVGPSLAQEFGSGWLGQYFNNANFSGSPVTSRLDPQINFNFGTGSPVPGFVDPAAYSIRWSGLQTLAAGTYRFFAGSDGLIRVTVGGQQIINQQSATGAFQIFTADFAVADGTTEIVVEYAKLFSTGAVQFYWQPISTQPTGTPGPTATATATGLPPIPPGALRATVVRAAVLNVRDAPSLGGGRLTTILRGQTYAVVGRNEDATWFLLQLADRRGWAWGYYLFIDGNEFTAPIVSVNTAIGLPPGIVDVGVLAQTRAGMRMRGAPNLASPQTGRIPWGSFLPVVGRTPAGDWYQVVWKGTVGWVFTGYLRIVEGDIGAVPIR